MTRRDGGFTLLEMLVALALGGLVMLLLVSLLSLGSRGAARIGAETDGIAGIAAARQILLQAIRTSVPALSPGPGGPLVAATQGTSRTLRLLQPDPPQDGRPGGLAPAEIAIEDGPDGTRLLLVRPWGRAVLLSGLAGASFGYFGAPGLGQRAAWQPIWRDREEPPRLIRLDVRLPPGDLRSWPPFEAAPRAAIDGSCDHDLLAGTCRTAAP